MEIAAYIVTAVVISWMLAMFIAEPPREKIKRIEDEIKENRLKRKWGML